MRLITIYLVLSYRPFCYSCCGNSGTSRHECRTTSTETATTCLGWSWGSELYMFGENMQSTIHEKLGPYDPRSLGIMDASGHRARRVEAIRSPHHLRMDKSAVAWLDVFTCPAKTLQPFGHCVGCWRIITCFHALLAMDMEFSCRMICFVVGPETFACFCPVYVLSGFSRNGGSTCGHGASIHCQDYGRGLLWQLSIFVWGRNAKTFWNCRSQSLPLRAVC